MGYTCSGQDPVAIPCEGSQEHPRKTGSFLASRNVITFSDKSLLLELIMLFIILFKL